MGLLGVGAYAFLDNATNINFNHAARSVRRSVGAAPPPPPAGHKLDHVESIPSADPPQQQQRQQLIPQIDQSVEECPYETDQLRRSLISSV